MLYQSITPALRERETTQQRQEKKEVNGEHLSLPQANPTLKRICNV